MNKILILSDSHALGLEECIIKYIKDQPHVRPIYLKKDYIVFRKNIINENIIDIVALCGRTAYNFSNHFMIPINKKYNDTKVILFLGFNDISLIKKYKNIEEMVSRYVTSAIKIFGKENIILITPLKNLNNIKNNPDEETKYQKYINYLKEYCENKDVKCYDINSIIGNTSIKDLVDDDHIRPELYVPLYSHLGII